MKNSSLLIARKELARFFSNKTSALVSILMPGLLIFGMWTLMGSAMDDMLGDDESAIVIAVTNMPDSIKPMAGNDSFEVIAYDSLPETEAIREAIQNGEYQAFAVFPADFDTEVSEATAAIGSGGVTSAAQVEIYFDSTDTASMGAYSTLESILAAYESTMANLFDVNTANKTYDVSNEQDFVSNLLVSMVPMLVLMLLFSGCMAVASESIAGEKERGTMATILATPVKRSSIVLGKLLALTLIGLTIAASSIIGIFAGLNNLTQGMVDMGVYAPGDFALLACVILATTLLLVMIISIISGLAKTTKEAQLYLTPAMIVVMGIGILGMFGTGAVTDVGYYFIPLYNSVQALIAILSFDFQPINILVCIVSNIVYTGIGAFVLQKMFNNERLMFAR